MQLVNIRTTWFTQLKQWGLYTVYKTRSPSSLAAIQRPGDWADNCKMVYSLPLPVKTTVGSTPPPFPDSLFHSISEKNFGF